MLLVFQLLDPMARHTLSVPILWHVTVVLMVLPASWEAVDVIITTPVCVATLSVTAVVVSVMDAGCHTTPFGHQHIRRRNLS